MKLKFVFALLVVGGSLGLRAQVSIAPVQFPLDSKEEAPLRNNLMVVGMGVSTDVEDGNGAAGGGYNARYSLRSHLGVSVVRPRWTSELKYWPQFSYYTRAAGYKNVAQAFGADLKYRLSKRLELNLRNSLTYTSDTFDAVAANALVSESPILDQPNSSILGNSLPRSAEHAGAGLNYKLSKYSTAGVGGNFDYLKNERIAGSSPALPAEVSQAGSANAYYARQIGRRSIVELRYDFHKLTAFGGQTRTIVHSVVGIYGFAVTPALKLSAFMGPDHSDTVSNFQVPMALRSRQWSWIGGTTAEWKREHSKFSGSFVRQISDGAGFGGAVRLNAYSAQMLQWLTPGSAFHIFVNYNQNNSILPVVESDFNFLSGGAGYIRTLSPHLSLQFNYMHIKQNRPQVLDSFFVGDRNRVSINLEYQFERPLGR